MRAAEVLSEIRSRGASVCRIGDRLGVEPAQVLDDVLRAAIREHRTQLLSLVEGGGGPLPPPGNSCNTATLAERTAAQWRVAFELLAASRWHVGGYDRDAARRWAAYETLAIWTDQDATASMLPSSEAEPLARAALEALGVFEPRGGA